MSRAIGLLSGGLDSMLAVRVLREQGVEVLAVAFVTPFFGSARAEQAAAALGVPLRALDITDVHFEVVKKPRHGWGRNMNPCIDCHALMLRIAGALLDAEGYDFLQPAASSSIMPAAARSDRRLRSASSSPAAAGSSSDAARRTRST